MLNPFRRYTKKLIAPAFQRTKKAVEYTAYLEVVKIRQVLSNKILFFCLKEEAKWLGKRKMSYIDFSLRGYFLRQPLH